MFTHSRIISTFSELSRAFCIQMPSLSVSVEIKRIGLYWQVLAIFPCNSI